MQERNKEAQQSVIVMVHGLHKSSAAHDANVLAVMRQRACSRCCSAEPASHPASEAGIEGWAGQQRALRRAHCP